MKNFFIFLVIMALTSCNQHQVEIDHLAGYWEISKAENAEGKSKEFPMNENIDYIVLKDSIGIRKKVKPQYSGSFKGSKDVEEFKILENDGQFSLQYTTLYDTWEEEIIKLTEEQLVLKNQNNITYTYKRYKGIQEFDEEK